MNKVVVITGATGATGKLAAQTFAARGDSLVLLSREQAHLDALARDLTLPQATRDATLIRRAAGECLKRVPLARRLRLLGVRVSALQRDGDTPPDTPQGELPFTA